MLFFLIGCGLDVGIHQERAGVLRGHVFLDDGTPVAGAEVSVGASRRTTDDEGGFDFGDLATGDATIVVRSATTTMNQVTVEVESERTTEVNVQVLALRETTLADAGVGGTVRTDDGLILDFPPNALLDEAGGHVFGEVQIQWALLNTAQSLYAAPGGLLAVEPDGDVVPLRSDGMVDVHVSQGGAPLTLAEPVEVSFPTIGNESPCRDAFTSYWFDEAEGAWAQDGEGRIDDGRFVATVEHFSYWNCDVPTRGDGCITVTLTEGGEPFTDRAVGVWLSDGTAAIVTPDALGGILVRAAVGSTVTVGVVYDAEAQIDAALADTLWSLGPVEVPGDGTCADLGSVEPTGVDQDGDGAAVQPWGTDCHDRDPSTTEPCPRTACCTGGDTADPRDTCSR